ncbi:hypothetical protein Leryth_018857 [Lithospermum erythrorhizon]|nr:hypothetical protein Leryth_018857 [Lithospermum erythrorhizon]
MKSMMGTKKRWKGLVIWVLALVVLSMLVHFLFILGLHTRLFSSSGYGDEHQNTTPVKSKLTMHDQQRDVHPSHGSKGTKSEHIKELMEELKTTIPKVNRGNSSDRSNTKSDGLRMSIPDHQQEQKIKANSGRLKDTGTTTSSLKGTSESQNCELRFGSYCLWRKKHREKMNDSIVKKMKDLLFVARAYYPSIAKMPSLAKFTQEMKLNIQDFERVLISTTTDKDLPSQIENKLSKMEAVIQKAKSHRVDCNNVDKKFRQLVDLTEDEISFHMKQSAFLYQLSVQTMPKSLHCLSMRLTAEHFGPSSLGMSEWLNSNRRLSPTLQHYVMFSNNVLASSVVINSTVMNAKETKSQVFHILTDRENFFAMEFWFFRNKYKEAVVQVLNVEELKLNGPGLVDPSHLSLPEEYRISINKIHKLSGILSSTEYVSVFSHMHYLLPEIFPTLKKIIILDEDVVVQSDLSFLWSLNMDGKVNGAVEECNVKLSQLLKYLGDEIPKEDSCAWMSGINVVDLERWRDQGLSKTFQRLVRKMHGQEGLSETASLGANFLAFQGQIFTLDNNLVVSGLGYNYGLNLGTIEKAAVLHFNGKMKPWLDLGIHDYSRFWTRYLDQDDHLLRDCNVNMAK